MEEDDEDIELQLLLYMRMRKRKATPAVRGGSQKGRRANIDRRRAYYARLLHDDYWGPTPVYSNAMFRSNFKLPIGLFDEIVAAVTRHNPYFVQRQDATGKPGATPLQKIAAAVRILTSGVSAQELDDKHRLASSTVLETLKLFCDSIIDIYSADALRTFRGALALWTACTGRGKTAPVHGGFQGKDKVDTVVLETIADHRGRFWHFNFGTPGALNDINVLDRSPLFHNAVSGAAPEVHWSLNGREYRFPYWLADGIYLDYECFLKTIPNPATRMEKFFASRQENKRKDIERAFGILQARFHILTTGCRLWDRAAMSAVIKTCVILHNVIIDYEQQHGADPNYISAPQYQPTHPFQLISRPPNQCAEDRAAPIQAMKRTTEQAAMQRNIMDAMWEQWASKNGDL